MPIHMGLHIGALMHELSNDGARKKFERYLDESILPVMITYAEVSIQSCKIDC